ncbi:MAG: fibronectin type III domain-containing protein [Candidatus Gracilibacteria bacterium]|nr:fibronectin type III domain-containing protein [Candidatus Gracilibacteria bacterium]
MNKRFFSIMFALLVSFFMLIGVQNANAEFKTTEKKSNNITFSWDAVEKALIYKIDYGTSSEKLDKSTDYIDSLSYTIFDLTPSTNYYFRLIGYDENANEIYKSEDISITTSDVSSQLNQLFVEKADMIGKNMIEISFSNDISDKDESSREFMVENSKDANELLEVVKTEISKTNKKNLILTLEDELVIGNSYKITVLNIRDIYDQNIEFGVDSEAIVIAKKIEESLPELNSASEEVDENTNLSETGSTYLVANEENEGLNGDLAGVDLNSGGVEPTVLTESTDVSKLPQTGPESILILLLAIIFSGIIFAYRFRKI